MSLGIGIGGAWKNAPQMWVGVGGAWKAVAGAWVGVGGVWKPFWTKHVTTLTIGDDGFSTYGYAVTAYGSMADTTYSDGGGTTRTIRASIWADGASSNVVFAITGASVPNTDATFVALVLNGVSIPRSSATYNGSAGGGTFSQWSWTGINTTGIGTSGTIPYILT